MEIIDKPAATAPEYASQPVLTGLCHPSPTNPRKTFDPEKHAQMVESVKRHGVLQPIVLRLWPMDYAWSSDVMPTFEIVAGECRWRAATEAGLRFIPAMVRDLTTLEVLEIQVIENLHRNDLHPLEEAEGFDTLMQACQMTADELAEKIGKSRGYIYGSLKLLALTPAARDAFRARHIDKAVGTMLARIPPALQDRCLGEITERDMTHRQASAHIQDNYMLDLKRAAFPGYTLQLVEGNCADCPRRTGNQPELFRDVRSADLCTDPECYNRKKAYHLEEQKAQALEAGRKVIQGEKADKLLKHGIEHMTGYKALDTKLYESNLVEHWGKPVREAIQGIDINTQWIPDPKTGRMIEIVDEGALRAALRKANEAGGGGAEPPHVTEQREKEKAARAEAEFRRALLAEIRAGLAREWSNTPMGDALTIEMRLIARQFWSRTGHESQKRLARAWTDNLSEPFADDYARIKHITNSIEEHDFDGLVRLMIEVALVGMTDVASYQSTFETPSQLIDAARRYDVDIDALKSRLEQQKIKKSKKSGLENLNLPIEAAQAGESSAATQDETQQPAKAARAREPGAASKAKKQAAGAARKGEKSGRASPAGGTNKQKVIRTPASSQKQRGETVKLFDGPEGPGK